MVGSIMFAHMQKSHNTDSCGTCIEQTWCYKPQAMNDHSQIALGLLGNSSVLTTQDSEAITFLDETNTTKALQNKPSGVLQKMVGLLAGFKTNP